MKSSKLFWVIIYSGIFFWLVLLGLLTLLPSFPTTYSFYDYLHDVNVSSQYSFELTRENYLFDPVTRFYKEVLIGDYGYLIIFGSYLLIRIAFWVHLRKTKEPYPAMFKSIEKALNFFSGTFIFFLLGLIVFIIGGLLIAGPLSIIIYGFSVIHAVVEGLTLVMGTIVIGAFILTYFPNSALGKNIRILVDKWQNRPRKPPKILFTQHLKLAKVTKELKRIVTIGFVFGYLMLLGYAMPLPTRVIQTELISNEVLFDFHVHTCRSDGWPTPAQRVEWYRSYGIQGAAFADHHSVNGAMEAHDYVTRNYLNFTVIITQEYSPSNIHMNIYGINETINPIVYYPGINFGNPRIQSLYLNVSDTIKYVKAHGGYITVNHYGQYTEEATPYSIEQLRDWGVDGFEIVGMGGREINATITDFCVANHLICIGGSDTHEFEDLKTFVRLRLDDPNNRTLDAIFQALRRNEHQVVSIKQIRPEMTGMALYFGNLGRIFVGMNMYQRLAWWIWSGIMIVVIFLIKPKFIIG